MIRHLVINLDGLLVSSFVIDVALSLFMTFLLRFVLQFFGLWKFFWNPPLAQLGIAICLLGFFTVFL